VHLYSITKQAAIIALFRVHDPATGKVVVNAD
jgi:hypothetical protein